MDTPSEKGQLVIGARKLAQAIYHNNLSHTQVKRLKIYFGKELLGFVDAFKDKEGIPQRQPFYDRGRTECGIQISRGSVYIDAAKFSENVSVRAMNLLCHIVSIVNSQNR